MTKIVIITAVLLILVGGYYLIGSKITKSLVPSSYNSTTSAQLNTKNEITKKSLEAEVDAITLSTDDASALDLTAIDEDIKGLE